MRIFRVLVVAALAAAGAAMTVPAHSGEKATIVFNGEDNRLNAYDAATGEKQLVIHSAADAEDGSHTSPSPARDINAQLCFFPDGSNRFVAGEDTGQGSVEGQPGWGIFQLHGTKLGEFSADQIGKLTTTFQTSDKEEERQPCESNPENYGCGFLSDGRVVTSDVGNEYPGTPNNGQLIVWFPPFDSYDVKHCKVDVEIPTAGGIHVDEKDQVYVAANRPGSPDISRFGGIYKYDGSAFPTSPDACNEVPGELFIPALPLVELATPSAIVSNGKGGFYVSSVFDGKIAEYDGDGSFQRFILDPGPGLPPFDTGTPFGVGVGPDGTIYYADLGVVVGPPPGPGDRNGTVRRIRFVNGEPQAPETMDEGLNFPDGIGILQADADAEAAPVPAAPAQVMGVSTARGQSTLPATGGAGFLLLGLVALAGALGVRAKLRT